MNLQYMEKFIGEEIVNQCRDRAEDLARIMPTDEQGELINWYKIMIENEFNSALAMPCGWFQWWDNE